MHIVFTDPIFYVKQQPNGSGGDEDSDQWCALCGDEKGRSQGTEHEAYLTSEALGKAPSIQKAFPGGEAVSLKSRTHSIMKNSSSSNEWPRTFL